MRRTMIIAALLAATTAAAQEAGPHQIEAVLTTSGSCAVLPMLPGATIPMIEVTIDGKGPYRFAIDTGAQGHGRISAALARTLGLAVVGEVRTPAPGGTVVNRPVFAAPELSAGGITFHDAQLIDMSNVRGPEAGWDGILGFALFQKLLLTIDYGNAQVRFGGAGLTGGLPLTFDRATPVVPIGIAGKTFPVHLDTGNGASPLFLSEADAKTLPLSGPPIERGKARTSFGEFSIMEAPLAAPVTAGAATLPVRIVGYPNARPGGNLGSRGLSGMALTVDQAAKLVEIKASAAAPVCPA